MSMDVTAKDLRAAYTAARADASAKVPNYPSKGFSIGACDATKNAEINLQLPELVNYILAKGGWEKVRVQYHYTQSTSSFWQRPINVATLCNMG
jgi:hypothetical protein